MADPRNAGVTHCDVADCPHEGTNVIVIEVVDPVRGVLGPATVSICDVDFRAVHDTAIGFTLGLEEPA